MWSLEVRITHCDTPLCDNSLFSRWSEVSWPQLSEHHRKTELLGETPGAAYRPGHPANPSEKHNTTRGPARPQEPYSIPMFVVQIPRPRSITYERPDDTIKEIKSHFEAIFLYQTWLKYEATAENHPGDHNVLSCGDHLKYVFYSRPRCSRDLASFLQTYSVYNDMKSILMDDIIA